MVGNVAHQRSNSRFSLGLRHVGVGIEGARIIRTGIATGFFLKRSPPFPDRLESVVIQPVCSLWRHRLDCKRSASHKFIFTKTELLRVDPQGAINNCDIISPKVGDIENSHLHVGTESCRPNPTGSPMPRILSISYDEALLRTRTIMLNVKGFEVEPVLGFSAAIHACITGDFDLAVICHSIPNDDKECIIRQVRAMSSMLILTLRQSHEAPLRTTDHDIDSRDPQTFLDCVTRILKTKGRPS
jgi:hypothetical protein